MEVFFRVSLREHENVILKEKYILYSKKFGFTKQVLVFPINFQMEYFNFVSLCSLSTQSARALTLIVNSRVSFYRTLTYEQVSVMEAASIVATKVTKFIDLQKKIMNNSQNYSVDI